MKEAADAGDGEMMGASDFFSKAMEFSIYALGTAFGIAVLAFSLFEVLRDMFGDLFRRRK